VAEQRVVIRGPTSQRVELQQGLVPLRSKHKRPCWVRMPTQAPPGLETGRTVEAEAAAAEEDLTMHYLRAALEREPATRSWCLCPTSSARSMVAGSLTRLRANHHAVGPRSAAAR
jgi:hypothetical protein